LSLLINKHGQKKGDRPLYKSRAYPRGSEKYLKAKEPKMKRGRSCSKVKKHSSDYFTLAVKTSGETFLRNPKEDRKSKNMLLQT